MAMAVSLPMYNLPEMQSANAQFWHAVRTELARRGLGETPELPDYSRAPVPERIEPDTLFTQVCGYPLQTIYAGQARLLGVPAYAVPGCAGPTHAGAFIVHRDSRFRILDDLRGCHFAFNSIHSNSGMNLPRRALAELAGGGPVFASIVETHSQPGNIERVARSEVDATCVDCVTYAFYCRHRPQFGRLTRVLAFTPPSPAIPFVTAAATPEPLVAQLQAALFAAARSPEWAAARAGLLLDDIMPAHSGQYAVQLAYEREAAALGYPMLA